MSAFARGLRLSALALLCGSAPLLPQGTLVAQQLAGRLGAGPAYGEAFGAAGMLRLELRSAQWLVAAEAGGAALGESADWEGSARALTFGAAAGFTFPSAAARLSPYVLARIAAGLDPREADRFTAFGASLGIEGRARLSPFAELRYDYWRQRGLEYYQLPAHVFALVAGLALH